MQSNTDLLIALKKKEVELNELLRIKKKYETDIEILREKYIEKEYRLKRTEEELMNCKQKLKQFQSICGNSSQFDLPSTYLKLKEEFRELKENYRNTRLDYERQLTVLNTELEVQKSEFEDKIQDLNERIANQPKDKSEAFKEECYKQNEIIKGLKNELESCQDELAIVKQENLILIDENLALNQQNRPPAEEEIQKKVFRILQLSQECLQRTLDIKSRPFAKRGETVEDGIIQLTSTCKEVLTELLEEIVEIQSEKISYKACTPQ